MRVTITKLRQELFKLAEQALHGESVEFLYKGVLFRLAPEIKPSKLARLTGQTVVASDTDWEQVSRDLFREMESDWEKDWSQL